MELQLFICVVREGFEASLMQTFQQGWRRVTTEHFLGGNSGVRGYWKFNFLCRFQSRLRQMDFWKSKIYHNHGFWIFLDFLLIALKCYMCWATFLCVETHWLNQDETFHFLLVLLIWEISALSSENVNFESFLKSYFMSQKNQKQLRQKHQKQSKFISLSKIHGLSGFLPQSTFSCFYVNMANNFILTLIGWKGNKNQ